MEKIFTSEVIVALITAGSTLVALWLKEQFFPNKLKKEEEKFSSFKTNCYIELDRLARTIKDQVNADGVYIAYFHNGGQFINGVKMDKFTVVGEDYNTTLTSYKKQYRDTMVNNISYLVHNLLVGSRHFITDVTKDVLHDLTYTDDLKKRDINSIFTFLIKDPVDESPLGFISLEYHKQQGFNAELHEKFIWKYQNRIATYLNMMKPKK